MDALQKKGWEVSSGVTTVPEAAEEILRELGAGGPGSGQAG